ncbi:MAG: O-antigen ligase family protein [Vicinamibacterales bacterium]
MSPSTAAFVGVSLLALVAPFETTRPLLRLPGQSLSNLEAAIVLAFGAWVAALVWSSRRPDWRSPMAPAFLAFVAAMGVAALAAPADRVNALHMTGRLLAAFGIYLLATGGVTTPTRLRTVLGLSVASAVVVAVLAIGEYVQIRPVLSALRAFRPGVTAVGGQLRAGGSLQYPTIASMYLEVAFAFGLGLLLFAVDALRHWRATTLFVALVVIAEAITLTFTRAGLLTVAASLIVAVAVRWRERGLERGVVLVGSLGVVIAVCFVSSRSAQSLWLRMTSEGQESWYRASVAAPAERSFATDRPSYVPVTVSNTGRLTWDSRDDPPFYFSYHWIDASGDRVVTYDGARTEFPDPVPAGSTATLVALVRAPRRPGTYRLEWDIVQEGRLWFSTEPGAPASAVTVAVVSGEGHGGPLTTVDRPRRTVRPGRIVLWRAAARMFVAHPLLGVGPDNFRLLYGPYADLTGVDPRTHSNNMYLEVLTGGGLVGAFSFCWLLWRAAGNFFTRVRPGSDTGPTRVRPGSDPCRTPIAIGVAAAGIAIALHGLVDSFLSFAPTYVLFSLTLGLAAAIARGVETRADAHRV